MVNAVRQLQGRAIVTLNGHPAMRALFSTFEMERVDIQYTVGRSGNAVSRGELIIYSWNRSDDPLGLF